MNWFIFFILTGLFILLLGLAFSTIKIEASVRVQSFTCICSFRIQALLGLIRVRKTFNVNEWLKEMEGESEEAPTRRLQQLDRKKLQSALKEWKEPLIKSLKRFRVNRLVWKTQMGTGEAAETGWSGGILWSVKSMVRTWLPLHVKMKKEPEISLLPLFRQSHFESVVLCMISISVGNAIKIMMECWKHSKKLKLRRKKEHGTSNQRLNDNGDGEFEGNDRCQHNRRRSG